MYLRCAGCGGEKKRHASAAWVVLGGEHCCYTLPMLLCLCRTHNEKNSLTHMLHEVLEVTLSVLSASLCSWYATGMPEGH